MDSYILRTVPEQLRTFFYKNHKNIFKPGNSKILRLDFKKLLNDSLRWTVIKFDSFSL